MCRLESTDSNFMAANNHLELHIAHARRRSHTAQEISLAIFPLACVSKSPSSNSVECWKDACSCQYRWSINASVTSHPDSTQIIVKSFKKRYCQSRHTVSYLFSP